MSNTRPKFFAKPTPAFFEFVRAFGESSSRQSELNLLKKEIEKLKVEALKIELTPKAMPEFMLRVLYCEMHGLDVAQFHIIPVKMTQQANMMNKYTGYNAVSILLHETHDLMIMVINSYRKDLLDKVHFLAICAALTSISRVITVEAVSVLKPFIPELMAFNLPIVRRKCVLFVHKIYLKNSEDLPNVVELSKRFLCDNDPSVMSAAIPLIIDVTKKSNGLFKNSVDTFKDIFKQVIEGRLGKAHNYKGVPAPFIQLKLLKFFAVLGENDQKTSEQIYPVIESILKRPETSSEIQLSILYEAINTLSHLYPNQQILTLASQSIDFLLKSKSNFIRYVGIASLNYLAAVEPRIVASYALVLLSSLDDPDPAIRKATLNLLVKICNASNVEAVVERLLLALNEKSSHELGASSSTSAGKTSKLDAEAIATEEGSRKLLVTLRRTHSSDAHRLSVMSHIASLAERLSPSNIWFVKTITRLLVSGGDEVPLATANNLLSLIGDGTGDDNGDAAVADGTVDLSETGGQKPFGFGGDNEMRSYAVTIFRRLSQRQVLPFTLFRVLAWVIGEFGGSVEYEPIYETNVARKRRLEQSGQENDEISAKYYDIFNEDGNEDEDDTAAAASGFGLEEESAQAIHLRIAKLFASLPTAQPGSLDDEILALLIERHPDMPLSAREAALTALAKIAARKRLAGQPESPMVKVILKRYMFAKDADVQNWSFFLSSLVVPPSELSVVVTPTPAIGSSSSSSSGAATAPTSAPSAASTDFDLFGGGFSTAPTPQQSSSSIISDLFGFSAPAAAPVPTPAAAPSLGTGNLLTGLGGSGGGGGGFSSAYAGSLLNIALPPNGANEDIGVDTSLSFLSHLVDLQKRENPNLQPYLPKEQRGLNALVLQLDTQAAEAAQLARDSEVTVAQLPSELLGGLPPIIVGSPNPFAVAPPQTRGGIKLEAYASPEEQLKASQAAKQSQKSQFTSGSIAPDLAALASGGGGGSAGGAGDGGSTAGSSYLGSLQAGDGGSASAKGMFGEAKLDLTDVSRKWGRKPVQEAQPEPQPDSQPQLQQQQQAQFDFFGQSAFPSQQQATTPITPAAAPAPKLSAEQQAASFLFGGGGGSSTRVGPKAVVRAPPVSVKPVASPPVAAVATTSASQDIFGMFTSAPANKPAAAPDIFGMFGGGGGGSSTTPTSSPPPPTSLGPSSSSSVLDLFGFGSAPTTSPSVPAPAPTSAYAPIQQQQKSATSTPAILTPSNSSSVLDLFGFGSSTPSAPSPSSSQSSFSVLQTSAPAPVTQSYGASTQTAQQNRGYGASPFGSPSGVGGGGGGGGDLFSLFNSSSSIPAQSESSLFTSFVRRAGSAAVPPFNPIPVSGQQQQYGLSVSFTAFTSQQSTEIAVFVTNNSGAALSNVSLSSQAGNALWVLAGIQGFSADVSAPGVPIETASVSKLPGALSNSAAAVFVASVRGNAALSTVQSLSQYRAHLGSNSPATLPFAFSLYFVNGNTQQGANLPIVANIPVRSSIIPIPLITQQFASGWGQRHSEKTVSFSFANTLARGGIAAPTVTPQVFAAIIQRRAIQPVDIKGNDVILAANVGAFTPKSIQALAARGQGLDPADDVTVLLHSKVNVGAQAVEVKIRSKLIAYAEALAEYLLQEFA